MYRVKTSIPRGFRLWEYALMLGVLTWLLFFSGCASGLRYAKGDKWQADTDRMVQLAAFAFKTVTGEDVSTKSNFRVVFTPERPTCRADGKTCHGALFEDGPGFLIVLKEEDCIPKTSLAHELIHFWALQVYGDTDFNHENPKLFKAVNSVEGKATAAGLFEGMCD